LQAVVEPRLEIVRLHAGDIARRPGLCRRDRMDRCIVDVRQCEADACEMRWRAATKRLLSGSGSVFSSFVPSGCSIVFRPVIRNHMVSNTPAVARGGSRTTFAPFISPVRKELSQVKSFGTGPTVGRIHISDVGVAMCHSAGPDACGVTTTVSTLDQSWIGACAAA